MKSTFKKIRFFLKKHIFSVICFLLATIICISGTLSYSKYITGDNTHGGASAGSFTASASINGISALSFTNTAFWGGSSKNDKIAMNALRQIKFSVNNYETDSQGNKKVADVRMRYNLVFSAPVVFASKLAFQVFDEHDVALLPQIVLADLLTTTSGDTYDTSTSVDYNSQSVGDLSFTVNKSTTDEVETITAESSTDVKITITTFKKDVDQSLLFRLWDVSSLTSSSNPVISNENGMIQPPVTVNYTQNVTFYKISVTMPDFVLPAAVATSVNHSIQLAPTSAIDDDHLGGTLVNVTKDTLGSYIYTSVNPDSADIEKTLYGPSEENNQFAIETVVETVTDSYYDTDDFSGDPINTETSTIKVTSNIQNYEVNKTTSSQYSYQTSKDIPLTDEEKESKDGDSTTTTTYVWNDYVLTDNAIAYNKYLLASDTDNSNNYSNYRNNTPSDYTDVGTYIGVGTAGDRGTAFYIHKLKATQTGTEIVSTIKSRQLISKTQVTNTEVTEKITCMSISGDTIKLSVEKTTDTKVSENKVYRTTSDETRTTVTREGYVYRMYYYDTNFQKVQCISRGGSYDSFCEATLATNSVFIISSKNENVTYKNQVMFYEKDGKCNYFGDESKEQYTSKDTTSQYTTDNTSDTLEQSTPTQTTNTEHIEREIVREYNFSIIDVTKISQTNTTENDTITEGNTTESSTTTETTEEFTSGNPLYMYKKETEDGKEYFRQQYYLSSSYSKNYPFYVNVIFEQVLN